MAKKYTVETHVGIARFFGLGIKSIEYWSQDGMPGERGAYDLSEIAKWLQRRRWKVGEANKEFARNNIAQKTLPLNGDAKEPEDDNPEYKLWQARRMKEQAKRERLKRRVEDGELVRAREMKVWLGSFVTRLRGLGANLERNYGADALEMLNDVLDEIESEVADEHSG